MPEAPQTVADLIGKTGPSLSATSDMPAPVEATAETPTPEAAQPEPVAETAKADEAKADAKPDETQADTGAEDKSGQDTGEPGKDETPPWMKREITKARNRQRDAEARATAAEARLDAALKLQESRTGESAGDATRKADQTDPKPQREKFDTPDSYEDALIQWSTRRAALAAKAELTREQTADQERRNRQELAQNWTQKVEKAREDKPDFDEVALADFPVTDVMAVAIQSEENGTEILYHLGQNQAEATRIAKLPPGRQLIEIGKLSASLVKTADVSKAPPPPRPIGSRAKAARKSPDEESMEEYAARRQSELRSRRTGAGAVH